MLRTALVTSLLWALGLITVGAAQGAPPPNDAIENATPIATLPTTINEDVTEATTAPSDPGQCGTNESTGLSGSVWFTFTAASATRVRLTWAGTDYFVAVDVFAGPSGSLTPIACWYNTGLSDVRFDAASSQTYYILVRASFNAPGHLSLTAATGPTAPANDHFEGAKTITGFDYADAMDTRDAIAARDDPLCGGVPPLVQGPTVWYSYTPPTDVRATPTATGYGTQLCVYTGTKGALTQVWDKSGLPTVDLTAGTTYHAMVGGGTGGDLAFNFPVRADSAVTLVASRNRLVYGRSVTLNGMLDTFTPPAVDVVSIYADRRDAAPRLVADVPVDSEGSFQLTLQPEKSWRYTARWPGDDENLPSASPRVTVGVQVDLSARLARFHHKSGEYKIYRRGVSPLYVVSVDPPHKGHTVIFRLERKRDGAWRRLASVGFGLNRDGVVGVAVNARLLERGVPYRIRGSFRGDGDHLGATAGWSFFKVAA